MQSGAEFLDAKGILAILQSSKGDKTQKEMAEQLGISASFLSDVLAERRDASDRISRQFGYERLVVYKRLS